MSDKVRLASVGLGRWARVLARGAQRGDVEIIEPDSCFGQRINGRGLVLRAIAAKVTETNIIKDSDYDIGFSKALARLPRRSGSCRRVFVTPRSTRDLCGNSGGDSCA